MQIPDICYLPLKRALVCALLLSQAAIGELDGNWSSQDMNHHLFGILAFAN